MKDFQTVKIFLVDDDPFYLHIVAQELKQKKFKDLHLFSSGEDCINNLHLNPDVIILDYRMESMSGLEVLRKVKAVNPEVVVIFLTAQKQLKVAVDSMKSGAFDYIEKGDDAAKAIANKIFSALGIIDAVNG